MKKTYITPQTVEYKMEISQMVCVSGTMDPNATPIENPNEVGSRSVDFFEDEDF